MTQTASITRISTKLAKSLATAYAAWREARIEKDDLGIAVWGDMLVEAQDASGVEMVDRDTIKDLVRYARERRAAAQRVAA